MRVSSATLVLFPAIVLLFGCPDASTDPAADAGETADAGNTDAGITWPAPFTLTAFDSVRISSHSTDANFQKAFAEIDWGDVPKSKVTLHVELATTCYPFTGWEANPPPNGQNWPADCDAFDRNFEFVLDPSEEQGDRPGVELVRAITPFGGPLTFDIDITDVANGLPGAHTLKVSIPTWSDGEGKVSGTHGGWNVTARVLVEPGPPPRNVLAVIPLADTSVTTAGRSAEVTYEAPAGTTHGRLEYRVSGHGGGDADSACIGHADEFCKRTHKLFFDGEIMDEFIPWRDDCGALCTPAQHAWPSGGTFTYCQENPCGNMASVRAPRANWCPGSVTPPRIVEGPWTSLIKPGAHTFAWDIDKIAPNGGVWRLSATYFAYGD